MIILRRIFEGPQEIWKKKNKQEIQNKLKQNHIENKTRPIIMFVVF